MCGPCLVNIVDQSLHVSKRSLFRGSARCRLQLLPLRRVIYSHFPSKNTFLNFTTQNQCQTGAMCAAAGAVNPV
jgi:hypothetical protein